MKTKRFGSGWLFLFMIVLMLFTFNTKVYADTLMQVKCSDVILTDKSKTDNSGDKIDLYFMYINNDYSGVIPSFVMVKDGKIIEAFNPIDYFDKTWYDDPNTMYKDGRSASSTSTSDINAVLQQGYCPLVVQSHQADKYADISGLNFIQSIDFGGKHNLMTKNSYLKDYQFVYYETIHGTKVMELYTANGEYGLTIQGANHLYYNNAPIRIKEYITRALKNGEGKFDYRGVVEDGLEEAQWYVGDLQGVALIKFSRHIDDPNYNFFDLYNNSNLLFSCWYDYDEDWHADSEFGLTIDDIIKDETIQRAAGNNTDYFKFLDEKNGWYDNNKDAIDIASVQLQTYINTYDKLIKESEKINEAIKNNTSYSATDATIKEFIKMFEENSNENKNGTLFNLLNYDEKPKFTSMDDSCNFSTKTYSDPGVSLADYLGCRFWNVHAEEIEKPDINLDNLKKAFNSTIFTTDEPDSSSASRLVWGGSFVTPTFINMAYDQYDNLVNSKNISAAANWEKTKKDYLLSFAKAASYIEKNYTDFTDNDFKEALNAYKDKLREDGIELVSDCDSLFGEDLKNKIGEYLKIVKIAVPIILMAFGILDFAKALFAGDDEKMRKAQKQFLLRVVIAILFFFVPTIVNIILEIANKVWGFISPSSCI